MAQSEADEVAGLDKVLTRLAVTEDVKLEQVRGPCQSQAFGFWGSVNVEGTIST